MNKVLMVADNARLAFTNQGEIIVALRYISSILSLVLMDHMEPPSKASTLPPSHDAP